MNPNLKYEIKARAFFVATGYVAPGKDQPQGLPDCMGIGRRQFFWDEWIAQNGKTINVMLKAFEEVEAYSPENDLAGSERINKALNESGVPIGNEHTTYTPAERVLILVTQRDYYARRCDELAALLAKATNLIVADDLNDKAECPVKQ